MKLFISMSTSKFVAGDRVGVEFGKDDWSIGTVIKPTATGYKVDFDYGEQKLIKIGEGRIVSVTRTTRLKKPLTFAQIKVYRPVKVAPVARKPIKIVVPPTVPAHKKPPVSTVAPVVPTTTAVPPMHTPRDSVEELALEHRVGSAQLFRAAQHGSGNAKLAYMTHVWNTANHLLFGGQMQIPVLGFIKLMKNFRGLGQWRAATRSLRVSPRLFNATEAHTVSTLVHEMCHQAVSEIDKVIDRTKQGHGPAWEHWMRKCKLDPQRYNKNAYTDFMTSDEKAEHTRLLENRKNALETAQHRPITHPQQDQPAQYFSPDTNTWTRCLIVCKEDRAGKRWIVVVTAYGNTYMRVPTQLLHEVPQVERALLTTPEFLYRARTIRDNLQHNKDVKAHRAAQKKTYFLGRGF